MERTNFEKLQVYQLSEKLADGIWKVVWNWNSFAKDTVGKQIVRAADGVGANILKAAAEEACRTIVVSSEWHAALCTRLFIGYVEHIRGAFCHKLKCRQYERLSQSCLQN